jgi:hypothetical protein
VKVKEVSKQTTVAENPKVFIASSERSTRQRSCPPMVTRSVTSGPWSLEWLKGHVHGEAGVVSSPKHAPKQSLNSQSNGTRPTVVSNSKNILQAGGRLKHSAHNLKKVARLPDHDRKQVLKILMKKRRRKAVKLVDALADSIHKGSQTSGSSSSASVTNDWKNWVVLRGKEEEVKKDINDFGKALGVRLYNDKCNQFRLLSRGRKQQKERSEGSKAEAHTE